MTRNERVHFCALSLSLDLSVCVEIEMEKGARSLNRGLLNREREKKNFFF